MIVSMRPMKRADLEEVFRVTSQYPDSHGGPIHIGDPYRIGVTDIAHPTSGDPTAMEEDDVPVFWGCGFTVGQAVTGAGKLVYISLEHSPPPSSPNKQQ